MPSCERAGVRLHYAASGQGPAFVMLHANPFDHRLWLYQMARFSTWFRVIAPDFRGYGMSSKVLTPYSPDDLSADIRAIMDCEGAEEAIIAGCSVGSRMAMHLALDYPKRVTALILVGGNSATSPRAMQRIEGFKTDPVTYRRQYMRELVTPDFAESALGGHLLEMFEADTQSLSAAALEQFFTAANIVDCTSRLRQIEVPTLVINGQHDHSLNVGKRTASLVREAEHRIIPGAGHACCLEDPARFDAIVLAFLQSHGLAPAAATEPGGQANTTATRAQSKYAH